MRLHEDPQVGGGIPDADTDVRPVFKGRVALHEHSKCADARSERLEVVRGVVGGDDGQLRLPAGRRVAATDPLAEADVRQLARVLRTSIPERRIKPRLAIEILM